MGSHRRLTPGHTEPTKAFGFLALPAIQTQLDTSADTKDLVRIEGVRGSNPLSSTERSSRFSGDHFHVSVRHSGVVVAGGLVLARGGGRGAGGGGRGAGFLAGGCSKRAGSRWLRAISRVVANSIRGVRPVRRHQWRLMSLVAGSLAVAKPRSAPVRRA